MLNCVCHCVLTIVLHSHSCLFCCPTSGRKNVNDKIIVIVTVTDKIILVSIENFHE